jgi:hypothetical protein
MTVTITLGGLSLSTSLYLDGLENSPGLAMSTTPTLGGRMINTIGPVITGGRSLKLQSDNHITHAQMLSIKAMEMLGQKVTLVHPRGTFYVYISGINLTPDIQLSNSDSATDLWYSGTINLTEG